MSEVYFYHVTKQTVASALPQLLAKSIDVGWTVFIRGKDEESLKLFDDTIWTAQPESFIPHAVIGSQNEQKCGILLGTKENDSSNSDFLISVNGALISGEEISSYKRCALLFDDKNSDEMNIAREQWIEFTKADIRCLLYTSDAADD